MAEDIIPMFLQPHALRVVAFRACAKDHFVGKLARCDFPIAQPIQPEDGDDPTAEHQG